MKQQHTIQLELKHLYKKWPEAKRFLKALGCPAIEAEDIYQEALIIYCRKKEDENFVLTVDAFVYVRNTAKLLWYNQARKQKNHPTIDLEPEIQQLDDDWFQKEMKIKTVESAILQLGKQCRELLELFYGLGWSMVDIAKKIGLRNDKVAKAQKYRCLQKAKENALSIENSTTSIHI